MERVGSYVLQDLVRLEQGIEVWSAIHIRTGAPALAYRPVRGALPSWHLRGALPWRTAEGSVWFCDLPFGAVRADSLLGQLDLYRLGIWATSILRTLQEAQSAGLAHGRITPDKIWIRGHEAWLEGLGLPITAEVADEIAVAETFRVLAGDSYEAWSYAPALRALAEGRGGYAEAIRAFESSSAPKSSDFLPRVEINKIPASEKLTGASEKAAVTWETWEQAPAKPPKSTRRARPAVEPPAKPTKPVRLEEGPGLMPNSPVQPVPSSREPTVVRIDSEELGPSFEVLEPRAASGGRSWLTWLVSGVLILALGAGAWYILVARPVPAAGVTAPISYVKQFVVEPAGGQAQLYLLAAPPGSERELGLLAMVPGPVEFDAPGSYHLQVRSPGFPPADVWVQVPGTSPTFTIKLGEGAP